MTYKFKYPHIANLLTIRPTPRIMLGKRLSWTEKKDGSCITVWLQNKDVMIGSRNKEVAGANLQDLVKRTEEYPKVLKMLEDNPNHVIYVEACRKGRSVTGAEVYDREFLICFDIYDSRREAFLSYTNTYQMCYHRQMPVVKLWAETRHTSMKDLMKFKNYALKYCEAMNLEGMVIKTFGVWFGEKRAYIQAKVKLDVPEPLEKKIREGKPILPPIPHGDVMGAIDKVWQELGDEDFRNVKLAMPKIAIEVGQECKRHLYSKPKGSLFAAYQNYLENLEMHI